MSLAPADISERIATHLVSALATPAIPGPWNESRHPFGVFLDAPEIEHHSFVIRVRETETHNKDRQNGQTYSASTVIVRWAHRLRPEAAAADERDGLRAEAELTAAIWTTPPNPELRLQFVSASREDRRNGTVLTGELTWTVHHHHPLLPRGR